jgi:undecaprenyl-diphosphatase
VIESVLWGLVQGLTEFLPVSSSGHLRLIPEFLGVDPPDLATSAVLHLGTLAAVLVYYRKDVLWLIRGFRTDPVARRVATMIVIASVPAVAIGLLFKDRLDSIQESADAVGMALIVTGVVLLVSGRVPRREGTTERIGVVDAIWIGIAQAMALLPGISRSGMAITTGVNRGLSDIEAARFAFLMAIPVIAGGGLLELANLAGSSAIDGGIIIATIVAGVSGYWAISFLIKGLARWGMLPFAIYCLAFGSLAVVVL